VSLSNWWKAQPNTCECYDQHAQPPSAHAHTTIIAERLLLGTVVVSVVVGVVAGAVADILTGVTTAIVAAVAKAVGRAHVTDTVLGAVDTVAVFSALWTGARVSTVGTQATAYVQQRVGE
jgi:hypothetical protein